MMALARPPRGAFTGTPAELEQLFSTIRARQPYSLEN
jgi:hypothetical protein